MRQKSYLFSRQHRNVVYSIFHAQLSISFLACVTPLAHADTLTTPLTVASDTRIFNANWGWNNNDGNGSDIGVYQARDRSLLQFDFSTIPVGATLSGATLTLTASSNVYGGNPNGEAMSVYRITQAWTEGGVTWNTYDGTNAWASAGGDFAGTAYASSTANPGSGQSISWDVTSLANEWFTGAQANNGLMIINSGGTNGLHFVSSENGNVAARPFLATTFSTPTSAPSGAFVWNGGNGGSGAVDGSGSWSTSNGFWNGSQQTWADGNDVTFGAGSGTAGTVTVSGTVAPKSMWFTATGSGNYTLSGGNIDLGNATRMIHTDVDATVASDLSNGGVFKQGSGKLLLTGTNTYNNTTIASGTLQIGDGGTSGSLGTGAVLNNGTLIFHRSDSTTLSNSITGSGSVVKNGSGSLVFNNAALTYTGGTTVNAGTLEIAGSSRPRGAITVNNTGTLYSSAWSTTDAVNSLTINAGGTYHVAEGVASGGLNGGLYLNGGTFSGATGHWQYGNMRLDGNLYVGGTQQSVLSGDLRFDTTREVQVANTGDASGVDFLVSGKIGHVNNVAWGYMNKTGAGTMKISGTNELGGITVSAGKLILENAAFGVMNASGLVNNAITEIAITGSNDITWTNNSLRGAGTYIKTGTGTANIDRFDGSNGNMNVVIENGKINTLGGHNNYWAVNNTTIKSGGTLQVNTHTHIKNVTLQGGTLHAAGTDGTWGSLMFDNDITANGSAVSTISGSRIALANADHTVRAFTVESGSTLNITGDLENANGTTNNQLAKSGAGIMTLGGTNTYTGATTVSAGTLFVTGALANSSVTVNSSGTLGGTGSIGGNLTLDAGANLDVTPGILTITGSITLTDFSFADIIGWDAASAVDGTYTLLNGGSSVTFNGNTPTLSNPFQFSSTKIGYFQQGSLQAVIATVPETSTVLFAGLGSLLLIRRRRI